MVQCACIGDLVLIGVEACRPSKHFHCLHQAQGRSDCLRLVQMLELLQNSPAFLPQSLWLLLVLVILSNPASDSEQSLQASIRRCSFSTHCMTHECCARVHMQFLEVGRWHFVHISMMPLSECWLQIGTPRRQRSCSTRVRCSYIALAQSQCTMCCLQSRKRSERSHEIAVIFAAPERPRGEATFCECTALEKPII